MGGGVDRRLRERVGEVEVDVDVRPPSSPPPLLLPPMSKPIVTPSSSPSPSSSSSLLWWPLLLLLLTKASSSSRLTLLNPPMRVGEVRNGGGEPLDDQYELSDEDEKSRCILFCSVRSFGQRTRASGRVGRQARRGFACVTPKRQRLLGPLLQGLAPARASEWTIVVVAGHSAAG